MVQHSLVAKRVLDERLGQRRDPLLGVIREIFLRLLRLLLFVLGFRLIGYDCL